uniref:Uncharacterized protein n=1 Tax=Xiphophorus couchianus TaxID=32473 RepID=A0A3B5LIE8_9TELE
VKGGRTGRVAQLHVGSHTQMCRSSFFIFLKVGFLKTQHRYEIVFTLPEVPAVGKDVCPAPLPNPHLKITDISAAPEGGLKITCEYLALQEGVLCEEVLLLSETSDAVCIRVKVHARVMDCFLIFLNPAMIVKSNKSSCIGRESNPGLPRGRREFYH